MQKNQFRHLLHAYFRPILKRHSDIIFAIDCNIINQTAPQSFIKFSYQMLVLKIIDEYS